jgi:hypothetical protein
MLKRDDTNSRAELTRVLTANLGLGRTEYTLTVFVQFSPSGPFSPATTEDFFATWLDIQFRRNTTEVLLHAQHTHD